MIGKNYWTTGISVRYSWDGKWVAKLSFFDDGFAESESTEGTLTTRYYIDGLTEAIHLLKDDAEKLGIIFRNLGGKPPYLFFEGEESATFTEELEKVLCLEAEKMGWRFTKD